jgi:membrane protease YdiL (CAAX protease family)
MSYAPHSDLIKTARPSAGLSRLAVGALVVVVGFFALNFLIFIALPRIAPGFLDSELIYEIATGSSTRGALILLFSFGLAALALWIAVRLVHHRRFRSLIGPASDTWSAFARVSGALIILNLILVLAPSPGEVTPITNRPTAVWFQVLPFGLLAVFVQSSTEEFIFRGYLQSQLAARFKSPLIWMLLPSALFGLMHYNTSFGSSTIPTILWATFFGLLAADLTARTGNLGAALGFHFVTNAAAILMVSFGTQMSGLALYIVPVDIGDGTTLLSLMPFNFLIVLVSWLAARITLRV